MNKSSRNVALMLMMGVAAVSVGGAYALIPNVSSQNPTTEDGSILGHIELTLTDADGNVKAYRQTDNLIVTTGRNAAVDCLFPTSLASGEVCSGFNDIAVGIGTTSAVAGNTNVETQRGTKRTDASVTGTDPGQAAVDGMWAAGKLTNSTTVAITEAGLFDTFANATGIMFARQTFAAVNVGSADSLTVTWTITFADSDST